MQDIQDVTAAILQRDGEVLIARRKDGRHAGKWEFPGGKVDPDESPEDCLARELFEEFAIHARVGSFFAESVYNYGHGTIRLLAYLAEWDGTALEPQDHDAVAWVLPEDLLTYDLLPADVPLAERLAAGHK